MGPVEKIVIVGAGHAGGRAAQALRQAGFEGTVTLVGEENHVPYERPPLSKELIVTDDGLEKAQLHPESYYGEHRIDLVLGNPASAIDRDRKQVELSDGSQMPYDRLMLTTGARVRKLPIPGNELEGVYYLRTFDDSRSIRARLSDGRKLVVIGGGFIGLEIAASARQRGADVTVLEATERLMGRSVAPEIGKWFFDMHAARGVDIRLNTKIECIEGEGKVERIVLGNGEAVDADMVVIGIGIIPNTEIAEAAGLEIDNGIVVDEFGRTSDPEIFAAGDVANQPNGFTGRRLRLESYQNAQDQAMAVARNMIADEPTAYEDSLWVWTDQFDVNLQMTGIPESYDELVYRGDPGDDSFVVFYLKEGRIVGVNTINAGREMRAAQRIMQSGRTLTAAQLADTSVKLVKLAKG